MTETIASTKNPLLKSIRKAAAHGALTDEGLAIAEGFHLLEEALKSGVEIDAVIAAEAASDRLPQLARSRMVTVPDRVFAELTTTEQPQGVITLVRPPRWTLADALGLRAMAVVLDGVQDPGNAGAVIRSAEAFGATGVVFLKGTVNPWNPKCLRGAAGSSFRVPLVAGLTAVDFLAQAGSLVVFTAMPHADRMLDQADFTHPCAIVIGGEGRGVSEPMGARAKHIRIPTRAVESLNAAVAAGVLLYEARRQRDKSA